MQDNLVGGYELESCSWDDVFDRALGLDKLITRFPGSNGFVMQRYQLYWQVSKNNISILLSVLHVLEKSASDLVDPRQWEIIPTCWVGVGGMVSLFFGRLSCSNLKMHFCY